MIKVNKHKLAVLIILDGWGVAPDNPGNAISHSSLPNITSYKARYPYTILQASGEWVGLPRGEAGNSEVGHLNLGAGFIVYQDLPRINMAIADGAYIKNPAFLEAASHIKKNNSNLHIMGLIGSGGAHSSVEHLYALINFCESQNLKSVFFHLFTDGRDSPPNSSPTIIKQIEDRIKASNIGLIATVIGRYYAMDRDHRWDRTQKAYDALTVGDGLKAKSAIEAIENSYSQKLSDEFILPTVIVDNNNNPIGLVKDNDSVIFFNFRIDRPRQLTEAFVLPNFESAELSKERFDPYAKLHHIVGDKEEKAETFQRKKILQNLCFVTMTEYEKNLPVSVAFTKIIVRNPMAAVISVQNLKQLHLTETEKERFVTYYFNGEHEDPYTGEDRIIIPSPKVATYDLKPEMSSEGITKVAVDRIRSNHYNFIVINFPNADMVAHSGNMERSMLACQQVDKCLDVIVKETLSQDGAVIITADHGNVEEMENPESGDIDTEHSKNPVPCHILAKELEAVNRTLPSGILADVVPTILFLMGIPKPSEMTGRNLLS